MEAGEDISQQLSRLHQLEGKAIRGHILLKQELTGDGFNEELDRIIGEGRQHRKTVQNLIDMLSQSEE